VGQKRPKPRQFCQTGLSWRKVGQTNESDVRSAFEQYGTVESVAIITDRDTGRSKGFGFVEMSEEDANKAIAGLNGSQLNGRALTVNEAKPMVKRDFGGGGGRRDRY